MNSKDLKHDILGLSYRILDEYQTESDLGKHDTRRPKPRFSWLDDAELKELQEMVDELKQKLGKLSIDVDAIIAERSI